MPSGWPSAMAPPLTFTRAGSSSSSRRQATDWLAKASLISTRSRSATVRPARSRALRVAGTGPMPITDGSTPATAVLTTRARGAQAKLARPTGLHEHEGRRAVVDARRVARRHAAALLEGRLQRRQDLRGGVRSGMLVAVDDEGRRAALRDGHGDQLPSEAAAGDGFRGTLLAGQCEGVLVRAADAPALRHELRGLTQRDGRVALVQSRVDEAPAERACLRPAARRAGRAPPP